jgi:hypothetical protein
MSMALDEMALDEMDLDGTTLDEMAIVACILFTVHASRNWSRVAPFLRSA